jgi:hypothetical protein
MFTQKNVEMLAYCDIFLQDKLTQRIWRDTFLFGINVPVAYSMPFLVKDEFTQII